MVKLNINMTAKDNSLFKKNLMEALINKDQSSFNKLVDSASSNVKLRLIDSFSKEIKESLL